MHFLRNIRFVRVMLMVSIVPFLVGFSVWVQIAYSETFGYSEVSPEFEALKKRVFDLCSLSASERGKDPFYESLLEMEEEDFVRLLELFAGDSEIYQCLLDIRQLDPYLSSKDWGDWNEQVLTYTPPFRDAWAAGLPVEWPVILPVRNPGLLIGSGATLPGPVAVIPPRGQDFLEVAHV